jgi:hypothetical protein
MRNALTWMNSLVHHIQFPEWRATLRRFQRLVNEVITNVHV